MAVDYSPLLTRPAPEEVAAYRHAARAAGAPWASRPFGELLGIILLAVFGSLVAIPMFGGIVLSIQDGIRGDTPIAVALLALFALALGFVAFVLIRSAIATGGRWATWLRMDRFARANGFVFSPASGNPAYPGAIFSIGDSRASVDHFRTAEGRFLDFGNYRYTTGSGKNRATRTWGFLALKLDRRLPHMVLDARANNGLFGGTNLPATFARDQVLSLEGDFDRHFTLYCPREYERDALYVFTPDLMALLIDNAAPFDVEIVDDWMFVYSARPFRSGDAAAYARLLRIVETVGAKTLSQTDRYHDERTAAPFAANVVAPPGSRLRRGASVGAIILTIVAALIWGWSFVSDILEGFAGR